MTKKDYQLIASVIASCERSYDISILAGALALALREQNKRFNFTKFLLACGYPLRVDNRVDSQA